MPFRIEAPSIVTGQAAEMLMCACLRSRPDDGCASQPSEAPHGNQVAPVDSRKKEYESQKQKLRDYEIDAEIRLRFGELECKMLRYFGRGEHKEAVTHAAPDEERN